MAATRIRNLHGFTEIRDPEKSPLNRGPVGSGLETGIYGLLESVRTAYGFGRI
jgi:hypothetical protein